MVGRGEDRLLSILSNRFIGGVDGKSEELSDGLSILSNRFSWVWWSVTTVGLELSILSNRFLDFLQSNDPEAATRLLSILSNRFVKKVD